MEEQAERRATGKPGLKGGRETGNRAAGRLVNVRSKGGLNRTFNRTLKRDRAELMADLPLAKEV
jgi:hypothetical protein